MMHFGEHVTIDGYQGKRELLDSKEAVLSCIDTLPELLGMKKLSEPTVFHVPGNNLKDPGGWSGFVVIEESHISVHTFPERGFVSADVYTCKNGMDVDFILNFFKTKFDLKDIEFNFIKRGTRYPAENLVEEIA